MSEIGGELTCENLVAIANSEELASHPKKPSVRGERFLTWAAIAACLCSLLLLYRHLTNFALEGGLTPARLLLAGCTAFLVTALVYGSLVYLFARVGYLRRKAALVQPSRDELETVYNLNKEHPRVCILIPTYREEIRALRQTILSAALSEYPSRRIAVVIDDPPEDSAEALRVLVTTRCLVADLNALFREAAKHYRAELSKFIVRSQRGEPLDLTSECRHLADLYEGMANWIEALVEADEPEVGEDRHTSVFFRERIISPPLRNTAPARKSCAEAASILFRSSGIPPPGLTTFSGDHTFRAQAVFQFVPRSKQGDGTLTTTSP